MLHALHLTNFRSHKGSQRIQLRPLTLIVGPNGAGKTALLDALDIMHTTAGDFSHRGLSLPVALERLGHGGALWYACDRSQPLGLGVEFSQRANAPAQTYTATFLADPNVNVPPHDSEFYMGQWSHDLKAVHESGAPQLSLTITGDRSWTNEATKVTLDAASLDGSQLREDSPFMQMLLNGYRPGSDNLTDSDLAERLDLARTALTLLQETLTQKIAVIRSPRGAALFAETVGNAPLSVGQYGEQTIQLLSKLLTSAAHDDRAMLLESWAKRLGVDRLKAGWVEGQQLRASFRDPQTGAALPIQATGGGVQQLLPVLTELTASLSPRILAIDEVEHGLHPEHVAELAGILAEAVTDLGHQVIATSQSPTLVLALCQAVAQGRIAHDKVGIVAVERDSDGPSRTRTLDITPSGWLEGGWLEHYAKVERELLRTFLVASAQHEDA